MQVVKISFNVPFVIYITPLFYMIFPEFSLIKSQHKGLVVRLIMSPEAPIHSVILPMTLALLPIAFQLMTVSKQILDL